MPTLNEVRQSVQDRFEAQWLSETVFDYDNDDFTIPEGENWVRVVVRTMTRGQSSMGQVGNRKFATAAAVVAQVFVPIESGTSEADRLATKLANIFDGTRFDSLWFFAAEIRESGTSGEFHQYNVTCTFSYEDIK